MELTMLGSEETKCATSRDGDEDAQEQATEK